MTSTHATGQQTNHYAEIEQPSFATVRRGWDQVEVGDYLGRLHSRLNELGQDRDRHAGQARHLTQQLAAAERTIAVDRDEVQQLRDQLNRLTEPSESVEVMSERMQWMLQLARDEAEEIRRTASLEAAEITARAEEARSHHEAIRQEIDAERAAMEQTREALLATAQDEATRLRREAAEEQARLDSESVARRAKIEDEFASAMATRRSEVLANLAKTEAASREDVERRRAEATERSRALISKATEDAQRKVATVELQLNQLQGMRRQIADQLGSAHIALGQMLQRVSADGTTRTIDSRPTADKATPDATAASQPNGNGPAGPTPRPRPADALSAS